MLLMLPQDWLQLRKGFLSLNFTRRKALIRKTKMAAKQRMMKMTTTMMIQMNRMMTMTMKISPEVKKGMMVIQRMILMQMAMEELEVMMTMTMKTMSQRKLMMTKMRTRMKMKTMKMMMRKHLSHQSRRGSENINWSSALSSFGVSSSSEGSLARVSLCFRGRDIVSLVGNELLIFCL